MRRCVQSKEFIDRLSHRVVEPAGMMFRHAGVTRSEALHIKLAPRLSGAQYISINS